jgi:putative redox protein
MVLGFLKKDVKIMRFEMKEVGFKTNAEYGELHISGNEEYGFRPYQLMVASIAVCSGGVLRTILSKKKIIIEDITIDTNVTRNPDEANRIEKIGIHYTIKGRELKADQIEKAIHIASKNCPMARSVEGSIKIEETFELV